MVTLDPVWQNVVFATFVIIWVGGGVALLARTYTKQRIYLRRFSDKYPYLAGEPLFDVPRTFGAYRIGMHLMRERQDDPNLEQLRRAVRRRNRQTIYWIFGFPILFVGTMALLISTDVLRVLP